MIIFLPVRNGGHYVRQAVDSIVAQTDPDWWLVVLENGSTDDTVATVESYCDPRIELVPASEPLGIVENWRRTTAYLRNHDDPQALVTIIGHDDYLLPTFVEQIKALAEAAPDATLYQTAFDLIDELGRLIRPCRPIPAYETWRDLAAALCWDLRESYGTGYVFRASDYLAVGGIPDFPLLLSSDHLLFVRLARLGCKRTDSRTGCVYRLHDGSTSGGMSRTKINAHVEGLEGYVEALVEMGFADDKEGRDALACLLGRELWTLRLPPVGRVLTQDNQKRRTNLERRFAALARGVGLETWANPLGGRFARLTAKARRLARSASLYRQTRAR